MRSTRQKLGILFLVLIVALSVTAVGYARWSDQLTVTETVATGSVCTEFYLAPTMFDPFAPPPYYPTTTPDWNADPGFLHLHKTDKNVGWGEAEYTDSKSLLVTLHNVYPGYYNHVDFWVHNCGTIPVILTRVVVTVGTTQYVITGQLLTLDLNGNGTPDFQILWGNHIGSQLDPCHSWDISYAMLVLQDEDPSIQGTTLTFTIQLEFVQWNMA